MTTLIQTDKELDGSVPNIPQSSDDHTLLEASLSASLSVCLTLPEMGTVPMERGYRTPVGAKETGWCRRRAELGMDVGDLQQRLGVPIRSWVCLSHLNLGDELGLV